MKSLVIGACILLLAPAAVTAGMIVGIGNSGSPGLLTNFFAVDPQNRPSTPFGTPSLSNLDVLRAFLPLANTLFIGSPVNLYSLNVLTGVTVGYLCNQASDCVTGPAGYTYDSSKQNVYALGADPNSLTPILV
jgi:hypothetical protein